MLDGIFGALSDPTRRAILHRLSSGACSVTTLGEPFRVSAPAISKHLHVLESVGLIARWKSGRIHYCRMLVEPLNQADAWIEQHRAFWERQFDSLAGYLKTEEASWPKPPESARPSLSGSAGGSPRHGKKSSARGRNRKR